MEPIAFIIIMALIGAQAVLHGKNLSMLMQHCIQGENQFATNFRLIVWLELLAWCIAAYLYCGLINTGLDFYPPVFFIPVQAVFFALFTIICGGLFFEEFKFTEVLETVMFFTGISLILIGVYTLAPDNINLDDHKNGVSHCHDPAKILAIDTNEFESTKNTIHDCTGELVASPRVGIAGLIISPRDPSSNTRVLKGVSGGNYTLSAQDSPMRNDKSVAATPSGINLSGFNSADSSFVKSNIEEGGNSYDVGINDEIESSKRRENRSVLISTDSESTGQTMMTLEDDLESNSSSNLSSNSVPVGFNISLPMKMLSEEE